MSPLATFSPATSKPLGLLIACAATLVATSTHAEPLHGALDYHRYLQERDTTFQETAEYLRSKTGEFAIANKFWTRTVESRDADPTEDEVQRFHMAKVAVESAQKANPLATFSTDSPFTLMTEQEFAVFVRTSNRNHSSTRTLQDIMIDNGDNVDIDAINFSLLDDRAKNPVNQQPIVSDLTPEVDWAQKGCVSPVQNQGMCGSCWAFATIAAIESARCVRGEGLQTYSERHMRMCDTSNHGCNGGSPANAIGFANRAGVCPSQSMAQGMTDDGVCPNCNTVPIKMRVGSVTQQDSGVANAVRRQPVVAAIASSNSEWKQYKSGVLSACSTSHLDHVVLIYGTTRDAFLIKNSWGQVWGENGMAKVKRGGSGMGVCGILSDVVYPELV